MQMLDKGENFIKKVINQEKKTEIPLDVPDMSFTGPF